MIDKRLVLTRLLNSFVACGVLLASRIDEKGFRLCISLLLLCTAAALLIRGLGRFGG